MNLNGISTGAIMGGLAVILGAFGAHVFSTMLNSAQLNSFETAVKFQMYHALLLVIVGWINYQQPTKILQKISWLILVGTIFFSGSIYLLIVRDQLQLNGLKWIWPFTPLGGTLLIIAWLMLSIYSLNKKLSIKSP